MVLVETKSGPIELVKQGPLMFLQYNCNCEDALPYCKAMCCRMRMGYGVELNADEVEKFQGQVTTILGKGQETVWVAPRKNDGSFDCLFLSDDCKCTVHQDKPVHCKDWHCSPKGNPNDPDIKRRDLGWVLMPSTTRSE